MKTSMACVIGPLMKIIGLGGVEIIDVRPSKVSIKLSFRRSTIRFIKDDGDLKQESWTKACNTRNRDGITKTKGGTLVWVAKDGTKMQLGTPKEKTPGVVIVVRQVDEGYFLDVTNLSGKPMLTGDKLEEHLACHAL